MMIEVFHIHDITRSRGGTWNQSQRLQRCTFMTISSLLLCPASMLPFIERKQKIILEGLPFVRRPLDT